MERIVILVALFASVSSRRTVKDSKGSSLVDYECLRTNNGYIIPDPDQCDRFAHCSPGGELTIHLCPDGFGIDDVLGTCDHLTKLDCTSRSKLQPPTTPPGSPCKRANGFYEVEERCAEFFDCREGRSYVHACPSDTVFDPVFGTCVHPDETSRAKCNSNAILNFTCPNEGQVTFPRPWLRFGDHDRLPHPGDCSKYFVCLASGVPRLSSCSFPEVFNPKTGICTRYDKVPSCQNYYKDRPITVVNVKRI